jgi:hypothetical protein
MSNKFFFFFIYELFIFANTSFSKIRSINCIMDGFMFLLDESATLTLGREESFYVYLLRSYTAAKVF